MHSAAPGGHPSQAPPQRPLSGIRVLDLTNVLAGPYCSYQLALLGAEVVKVELPGQGDLARHLGSDPGLNAAGIGASFLAQNAGKKSVELDLKDPGDQAVFRDMVGGADVLLENFRAGVLDRMGFGWPVLRELNPALVYCAISGFGQTGPMRHAPAYDQVIQGLSGMMSITGTPETAPLRVGFPICDTVGGLMAALSIAAALTGRANTGRGLLPRRVDARGRHLRDGLARLQLPRGWRHARADGRPERHRRAVRHLRRGRRPAQHRGQPAGAVRDPVPGGRLARAHR